MTEKANEWAYSFDGHNYGYAFDSKDDAIQKAVSEAKEYGEDSFFLGRVKRFVPRVNIAEDLICQLQDQAADAVGEYSDGYLEFISRAEMAELNREIEKAFFAWTEKYPDYKPYFFTVPEAEKYNVNEGE